MRYLKWMIIFVIIILVIMAIISLWPEETEVIESDEENISLTFDDSAVDNVNFHNIAINQADEYYILTANITNLTADILNINNVEIDVLDSEGKVITTLIGYFGGQLNGDETKAITVKTKENLSLAKELNFNLSE